MKKIIIRIEKSYKVDSICLTTMVLDILLNKRCLVLRKRNQQALIRALEADLQADPVRFFKTVVMPLVHDPGNIPRGISHPAVAVFAVAQLPTRVDD